ncbi:Uncharacterized protein FWK35_00017893 [Aphis craccivora]|uniref:EF-hand domain-containing protein n=1 Tax=Aphis craccivora TaxID=307492 RepID=A0A6G0ZKL2_APHCR|nr:Uncharacterized protein FWK35_00017893 [Aphis craccivora]
MVRDRLTFDPHGKGHVTEIQFRRCLDMIGVSSLGSIYYPEKELSILLLMYKNKECPERINWKQFEDEINTIFMERNFEKSSDIEVKCDRNVNEMLRIKGQDWDAVELNLRILFNKTIININNYLNENRIMLEQYFKVFDKNNHGHISRSDFRRAMYTASIKCTEDELCILEKKFMNVDGFNYLQFLKMLIDINKKLKKCSVKRGRINLDQFLNQFDFSNHKVMSKDTLQRALDMAGIKLDSNELEILINEFESKTHPGQVEYHRFCNLIEGAFVTLGLDQNTYLDPNEYLTSYEGLSNYLTDEQRRAVDSALKKLRSKPNIGLDDLFKDYDKHRQGIVSKQEFLCALTVRKLNMLLSIYEVKCLAEAFSKDDRPNSFNYRAFMKTIDS